MHRSLRQYPVFLDPFPVSLYKKRGTRIPAGLQVPPFFLSSYGLFGPQDAFKRLDRPVHLLGPADHHLGVQPHLSVGTAALPPTLPAGHLQQMHRRLGGDER